MAVIENHNNDSLANVYSNARNFYYGITGFPTTKFDGVLTQVGGGSSSLYAVYLTKVNQRNAVPSDFTIDLSFEHLTGEDYTATAVIENVGGYTGSNLVLQVVVTESNLDINWGLGDDVNSVNRLMVPNQNGTPLDFSNGDIQTVDLDFELEQYWVEEHCELIAFVQDNSTKEILQATLRTMAIAEYDLDVEIASVSGIPEKLCLGEISSVVEITNKGAEVLTSCDINFEVNGELIYTHAWNGELIFPFSEDVQIPTFTFDPLEENEILVYVTDPNGGIDQNPDNNEILTFTESTLQCTDYVVLILKTDNSPQETTYEFIGPNGEILSEGGPFSQSNVYIKDTVYYEDPGCHQFKIYDSNGNGLTTFFSVRSFVDGSITTIHSGWDFGYVDETQFTALVDGVQAGFSSDISEGCEELTVNYTDMSVGDVTEWDWTFEGGDPATSTEQNPTVYYATPGTYDVMLTVSDGTGSNTIESADFITVWELPDVQIADIGDQCMNWPGFELTEGTPEGGEYSGPGVMDGWFYPEEAGAGTHSITYTYMDENGCENMAEQEILVDACTGVDEFFTDSPLRIYPNPVTSQSTIEYFMEENINVTLSIYNSIGMLVSEVISTTQAAGMHQVQVNTADFDNGIYFVKFSAGDDTFTQKMTIVK